MFLIPLDDTRVWYRYHHLFADMLRERLQHKCNAEEISELHRRAYQWYESQGLFIEAIQHALNSGDHDIAAHMMERNFSAIITQGEESRLKLWLEQTPLVNIIRRPDLFYFQVGTMARMGHSADARRFLERVEQILTVEASSFAPEVKTEVQMRMGLYGASLDFYQGNVDSFIQAMDINREGLLRFPSIVHVVNLGEALLYRGPIGFGGRLKKMAYLISLVSTSDERRAIIHATLQGHGFVFLANLNYEWNRLDEARIALDQGLSANVIEPNLGVMTPGYILQSKIYQAEGHLMEAEQTIIGAISEMEAIHSPYWQLLLEARLIRIKLTRGDVEAGLVWIRLRHLQVQDKSSVQREYEHVTLARVLMANHQEEEAIRWLTVLLSEAKLADRLGSQIEILLLIGLSHYALRQHSLAVERIDQALKLAESEGYVRIFLDEGKPLLRLLSWWLKEKRLDEEELSLYVERLLQAFSLTTSSVRQKRAAGRKDDNIALVSLTEREKQIMLLITEGRSNSEIAEQLFIAPGTVKRYVHNLYQKLEVSSRVQAVARMKELLTE
ncbi:LuxR C-terminal-related transcriptional regulator [Paenibacillus sp. FSL K6-2524]|uniref:LuxR C-terminal-related transcriptional regulator n=1 Tax=Paenibacillus sp. FSL K6-2524 TaxID=2954516 RepID=UPI0030F80FD1